MSEATVIFEFAISISTIWSLTGTTSFELGVTVNSITVDVEPLIFEIEAMLKEFNVI